MDFFDFLLPLAVVQLHFTMRQKNFSNGRKRSEKSTSLNNVEKIQLFGKRKIEFVSLLSVEYTIQTRRIYAEQEYTPVGDNGDFCRGRIDKPESEML